MSPLRLTVFLAIVLSITAGLHYYLWARLVRDPALPEPWFRVVSWAIVTLAVLMPVGMALSRFAPRVLAAPVMWVVYTWMGLTFFLFVLLGTADVGRLAAGLASRVASEALEDPSRRRFLARFLGAAAGMGALVLGGTGMASVLKPVAVKRVRVPLAKLPASLSGYTIVQISDIHVGPTIGRGFIEQLVARINALEPDLVAITGDLVDGTVEQLGALVAPLRDLRARDGVYFITGNHEYYSGANEWVAFLPTLGIRVLRNERVAIRGEGGFDLAGVDDWEADRFGHGHGADLPRALAGRDASRAVVLLAHQPKQVAQAAAMGVDLQLSGHTHGGQLFPFNYLVKLQQPFVAGLHAHGATTIYVSAGTGYWGPPMRVGAPAEITRIELVAERAS
jgi:hypothetical protein